MGMLTSQAQASFSAPSRLGSSAGKEPKDSRGDDELMLEEESAASPKSKEKIGSAKPETKPEATPEQIALKKEIEGLKNAKEWKKITDLLWKNIDKANDEILADLAEAHYRQNQFPEVLKTTGLAIAKNPKSWVAYTWQGLAEYKMKREKKAIESLTKATDLKRDYEPALQGIAEIYEVHKNYYELRILIQDMIEMFGRQPKFVSKLCEINTLDGVNDAATKLCREAVLRDPKNPSNPLFIAKIYEQTGEDEKAKSQFEKAVVKFPKSELVHFQMADYLERHKDLIGAAATYEKGTLIAPTSARLWEGLGRTAVQIQKYETAFKALEQACKSGRKYAPTVRFALGFLIRNQVKEWKDKFSNLTDRCSNALN